MNPAGVGETCLLRWEQALAYGAPSVESYSLCKSVITPHAASACMCVSVKVPALSPRRHLDEVQSYWYYSVLAAKLVGWYRVLVGGRRQSRGGAEGGKWALYSV